MKTRLAHIHYPLDEAEFHAALRTIADNLTRDGADAGDADIVVFVDHPQPTMPDGAIVVLENGLAVHVCVVDDWPEAPLARPYAHIASSFAAGREALLAGATPEEAAEEALHRWQCFTGDTVQDVQQLRENFTKDFGFWAKALRGEADAA